MQSEALIIAVTDVPSWRPSSRAASTVIEATSRWPLTSSSTLAIAAPSLMLVMVPVSWLRALSFMAPPLGGTVGVADRRSTRVAVHLRRLAFAADGHRRCRDTDRERRAVLAHPGRARHRRRQSPRRSRP